MDEGARYRLYGRLEEVLGPDEAETLMALLPRTGVADLITRADVPVARSDRGSGFELGLEAELERMERRIVIWTSSMVLASAVLAFAAGRIA